MPSFNGIVAKKNEKSRELWSRPRGRISSEISEAIEDRELHKRIRADASLHRAYIRRYQAGEAGLDRLLLKVNEPLIAKCVRRYSFTDESLDWWQEASLGVLEGLARYDESFNVAPITYLTYYAKWPLNRAVIEQGAVVRIPVHLYRAGGANVRRRHCLTFTEMNEKTDWRKSEGRHEEYEDTIQDEDPLADETLSDEDIERSMPDVAELLLRDLDERQKIVMRGRFWSGLTLQEIGDILDVSRERARQIESEVLYHVLRAKLQRLKADPEQYDTFHDWTNVLVKACRAFEETEDANEADETV